MTPLMIAVLLDNLKLIETLVERGANVNAPCGPSFRQTTALHVACVLGNLDAVRCLVELGADVHRSDCDGMDALKIAAVRSDAETLEFLIQV